MPVEQKRKTQSTQGQGTNYSSNDAVELYDSINSQLKLGYWKGQGFISLSPMFDAYRKSIADGSPISKGERVYNYDKKIFFQLSIMDVEELLYCIERLKTETNRYFTLHHKFSDDKNYSYRTLEIGYTDDYKDGFVELAVYDGNGAIEHSVIFDFAGLYNDKNRQRMTVPDGDKVKRIKFQLGFAILKSYLEACRVISLSTTKQSYSGNKLTGSAHSMAGDTSNRKRGGSSERVAVTDGDINDIFDEDDE